MVHPGRKVKYPEIEEELASWIKDNRDKSRPITRLMIATQNLPEDLVEKQQQFLSFILFRRREHNYPLKYIAKP
ncbi:981_t:CDS:2 [Paraglomus occultum]|uniref:981_t:CDS:1 n=1 Tax=Paraglomus occultum TaxID=144539 RepID=A0A9N9B588_9GLOM|nr:981_t:CDS:2 [Paraglomus occultum]